MKKAIVLLSGSICLVTTTLAQADTTKKDSIPVKYWKLKSLFGLNGSQTSFVNWAAGGRNNVSVLGFVDASLKYEKYDVKWTNDLKFALGGMRYMDSTGNADGLQKTDDKIDFSSTFGLKFQKHWYYTATAGFRTQSLDGFAFPNDSVPISRFMAPGYLNESIGIEYAPSQAFNVYISPIAGKTTFVRDEVLANEGAFGVDPAIRDELGNVITPGKQIRHEFGSYLRIKFQKEIVKNIEMKTKAEFFSNYLKNPQNIDVNVENVFTFKVNKWFSASLQWNLLYDDDVSVMDRFGDTGPRVQFKSVLGLGIAYTMNK